MATDYSRPVTIDASKSAVVVNPPVLPGFTLGRGQSALAYCQDIAAVVDRFLVNLLRATEPGLLESEAISRLQHFPAVVQGETPPRYLLDRGTRIDHTYRKLLIATVGLPYSGKTTWAMDQNVPVVSPDGIRKTLHGERFLETAEPLVWWLAHLMVEFLFAAGHRTVILDACNVSPERRAEWQSTSYDLRYKVMAWTDETGCLERAKQAGDTDILPVIERMATEYEPPPISAWWDQT